MAGRRPCAGENKPLREIRGCLFKILYSQRIHQIRNDSHFKLHPVHVALAEAAVCVIGLKAHFTPELNVCYMPSSGF
jgi:hypothetical protein